jgi:hypothetical protein
MSDLRNRLESSRKEVEMTVAEAEAELEAMRKRCVKLEQLIATGKAMAAAGLMEPAGYIPSTVSANADANETTASLGKELQELAATRAAR